MVAAAGAEDAAYQEASKCYHTVKALPEARQSRAKWFNCATLFEKFYRKYPKSSKASDALYSSGLSYRHIYEVTKNETDAEDALTKFNELVRMHPKDKLVDDALFNVGTLKNEALHDPEGAKKVMIEIVRWHPDGDMRANAEKYLATLGDDTKDPRFLKKSRPNPKLVKLSKITKTEEGDSEKVVLELTGPVKHEEHYDTHDIKGLALFTVELDDTYLSRMIDAGYSYVGKGIVRDIAPSQVNKNKSQVNISIRENSHCEIHPKKSALEILCSPGKPGPSKSFTSVAKAETRDKVEAKAEVEAKVKVEGKDRETPSPERGAKPLSVVVDAGHGGTDTGAIGKEGTREKDIALQIAKRLGWQLRNKLGMDVNYTRIEDRAVSLDARDKIANGFNADLFISVHVNAASSPELDGYQTFFLNNATDDASRKLAARENASLGKGIDDTEKIILTMMQNANTDESRLLAKAIHKNVLSKMSSYGLKDRGVKSALFYVLVGAKCPAVLIETSFITNADEEKKLKDSNYQESMASAIANGVKNYLAKAKTTGGNL